MILRLALSSVRNRLLSAALTVLSIALSVVLLLGVERVRDEARGSFTATVSGTDLVVGARTSPVHLLLHAVFHVGYASNNLTWQSYRTLAARPEVAWSIPLSMGDTHRGFRVVGTTPDFFRHFRFGQAQGLRLDQGVAFGAAHEAVLGADVARRLAYGPGQSVVLSHGAGDVSFIQHDAHPFRVVGVLARTGTPVDRAVYVSLHDVTAMHEEIERGGVTDPLLGARTPAARRTAPAAGEEHHEEHEAAGAHTPTTGHSGNREIGDEHSGHPPPAAGAQQPLPEHPEHAGEGGAVTAVLVGLKSRASALGVQRAVNEYSHEPLTAILPGPTLQEVWEIVGAMEKTLFAVSALVVLVGLAGMLVALLTSLNERRREMAILRAVGARPGHVFSLILGEAALLTLAGIALGVLVLHAGLLLGRPWLEARLGLFIPWRWPSRHELTLMATVAVAGLLIGLWPAWRIYRRSLSDGMTIRV